jgi:hypothetical protein
MVTFGIARLGCVAALNIQRLVYRFPDVAWDVITSQLTFVLHHLAAPQPICQHAVPAIDDLIAAISYNLTVAPNELQAGMQQRVLDTLAQ